MIVYVELLSLSRVFFPRRRHVQPHPVRPRATSHSAPSLTGYPEYVQYCNVRTTRIILYIIYTYVYTGAFNRVVNIRPRSTFYTYIYLHSMAGQPAARNNYA